MDRKTKVKDIYRNIRESWRLKNFLVFLVFLCVAAFFWFLVTVDYHSDNGLKETVKTILGAETDSIPDSTAVDVSNPVL